ncbi:MAG: hypothetical protein RL380_1632 [Verrucomicrobiota bacterium]|jgi:hypothetical protein
MKLLRNPLVVGVLAITAVILVCYQLFAPHRQFVAAPTDAPLALPPDASAANAAPDADPLTTNRMDRDFLQTHVANWLEALPRDPFRETAAASTSVENNFALAQMKLQAIWRQSDGAAMAIISKTIYREGDTIGSYKIEKIDDRQVWLQGRERRERLGFPHDATSTTRPKPTRHN